MFFPNMNMNVPNHSMVDHVEYFTLDDGRVWHVDGAKFVDSVPEGMPSSECRDSDGKATVEELLYMLRWNKYPLGELATDEDLAKEARKKRNKLLSETDYMLMKDYPLTEEKEQQLTEYRQALRDISLQPGFPRNIEWPVKP